MKEEKQMLPGGMYRGVENKVKVKTLNYVIGVLFVLLICVVIFLAKQGGYNVTYETDGGDHISASLHKYGDVIELTSPHKIGYEFVGWYSDEDLTKEVNGKLQVEDHVTLYAKYSPNLYTISFQVDQGVSQPESVQRLFMSEYGELPILYSDTSTFVGWALDNQIIEPQTQITLNGNHSLTAIFK